MVGLRIKKKCRESISLLPVPVYVLMTKVCSENSSRSNGFWWYLLCAGCMLLLGTCWPLCFIYVLKTFCLSYWNILHHCCFAQGCRSLLADTDATFSDQVCDSSHLFQCLSLSIKTQVPLKIQGNSIAMWQMHSMRICDKLRYLTE